MEQQIIQEAVESALFTGLLPFLAKALAAYIAYLLFKSVAVGIKAYIEFVLDKYICVGTSVRISVPGGYADGKIKAATWKVIVVETEQGYKRIPSNDWKHTNYLVLKNPVTINNGIDRRKRD